MKGVKRTLVKRVFTITIQLLLTVHMITRVGGRRDVRYHMCR